MNAPLATLLLLLQGATVVAVTPEGLADLSTDVVRGRIETQEVRAVEGTAGIATFSRLSVGERLKGKAPAKLVVRQVGGTLGRRSVELPGDARLAAGEEVLLFLRCDAGAPACTVVGLAQGKYRLEPMADGRLGASRDFSATTFVGTPLTAGPEPWGALAARLKAHVAGGAR